MFVEALKDNHFSQVVNSAGLVSPDGKPLCIALKWLYGISHERASGMDLIPVLLEKAEAEKLKVGFYGYTEEGLEIVKEKCQSLYPKLNEPLLISPPFRKLTEVEQDAYIKMIHVAEINLLFVALGCPKQEKWMADMKGKINTCMIGIGGALPVFAGLQKHAPKWMQNTSLEWLCRLLQEPRRLFKRYFITNSIFIYVIIKEKLKLTFVKSYKKEVFASLSKV
jgi:N-acetylglucosaminyldiphosphoundecaprenol N-acetyl-beta-D-mannosaminyltransferase